jgi:hypothetical protein
MKNKFYYFKIADGYKLEYTFRWQEGMMRSVTYDKLIEFRNSLNKKLIKEDLKAIKPPKSINKQYICNKVYIATFFLLSFPFMVLAAYFFCPGRCDIVAYMLTVVVWFFTLAAVLLCDFYERHDKRFIIFEALPGKISEIEDFINLWNRDYFIPNGVYVTCPRNMTYVNIGLKSLMLIDRHEFPYTFN